MSLLTAFRPAFCLFRIEAAVICPAVQQVLYAFILKQILQFLIFFFCSVF